MGMGCWGIGGPFWDRGGWMGYGDVEDAESVHAVHRALDLGVTLFDVSDVYGCGRAERVLGEALKGRRDEAVLVVEFGYRFDEGSRKVLGTDLTPGYVHEACEASLKRLGTERLDFYLLHPYECPLPQALEIREALERLVSEGKIGWYGWCTEVPENVRAFAEGPHCSVAPMLFNLLDRSDELLTLSAELNLAPIVRRPLGMGLLTGKFDSGSTLPENDMRRRFGWDFRAGAQTEHLALIESLRPMLQRGGRTLAQGALGWLWARDPALVPIPGCKTVAQVEENAGALCRAPLDPETMREIETVLGEFRQD
jgi:aryl-alcohol dehydrogenase-like predicted oxidoreductase